MIHARGWARKTHPLFLSLLVNVRIEHITGVLLAGGKSTRMGRDKRMLTVGGKSLFHHGLEKMESLFSEVIVVVAEITSVVENLKAQVVTDLIPDRGSAGGLYTGLFYASNPHIFAVACDMPFLDSAVIRHMCTFARSTDIVMVKLAMGLQPMHGVYSKRCLPPLEDMVKTERLCIQDLVHRNDLTATILDEETIKVIDPGCLSFVNVNTPADLEFATKMGER